MEREIKKLFSSKEEILIRERDNTIYEIERLQRKLNEFMNKTVERQIKLRDKLNHFNSQIDQLNRDKKIAANIL